jgi:hypothetical protein
MYDSQAFAGEALTCGRRATNRHRCEKIPGSRLGAVAVVPVVAVAVVVVVVVGGGEEEMAGLTERGRNGGRVTRGCWKFRSEIDWPAWKTMRTAAARGEKLKNSRA